MQSSEILSQLFPFHFVVNRSLELIQSGAALSQAFPQFDADQTLPAIVSIEDPNCVMDFESLKSQRNTLFHLRICDGNMILRGQWIALEAADGSQLAFAGSPWPETMAELSSFGIEIRDLGPFDLTVENLVLRQAQQKQAEDHERLLERLETARQREAEYAETERSLSYDLNLSADLVFRFDENGRILSAAALDPETLVHQPWNNIFSDHQEISTQVKAAVARLDGQREKVISIQFQLERTNETRFFDARVAKTTDKMYVLLARDVTDRRRVASRMAYLANHDPLTGLPNRACFEQKVSEAIERSQTCALLMIDINEFKAINDCYGHPAGDEVLKAIANRLNEVCRTTDLAARLGGDEFAIIAEGLPDEETATAVAERVLNAIMAPLKLEQDLVIHPRASIGIVLPAENESLAEVFRKVDLAMYSSKESTNAHITRFESKMMDEFMDRVMLKKEFDFALRRNELRVFYQPIISLETGECVACEALVRWQHPTRGLLSPAHFVGLAEESGEIVEMGQQVLRIACHDLKRLQEAGYPIRMSVNVSPLQLNEPAFVDQFCETVTAAGVSNADLILEITEQTCVDDPAHVKQVLDHLHQLGTKAAIDDFGAGYSALQYLVQLPAKTLKIDHSFVSAIGNEQNQSKKVVEAIVCLAKALNMDTVAEGIEEPDIAAKIRDCGCDFAQGYLFSRPLPFDKFVTWLGELDPSLVFSAREVDMPATSL